MSLINPEDRTYNTVPLVTVGKGVKRLYSPLVSHSLPSQMDMDRTNKNEISNTTVPLVKILSDSRSVILDQNWTLVLCPEKTGTFRE